MYRRYDRETSPLQVRLKPGSKQSSKGRPTCISVAPLLSLQDLCLLEVINDLDSYPVDLLSSLPHWMRYRLLNNLPVLDLCRLDHTPLARGVDIDKIWTARVESEPMIKLSFPRQEINTKRPVFVENLFQMNVYQSNVYQSNRSKGDKKAERIATLKKEMETAFQGLYDQKKFTNDKEEYLVKLTAYALSCSDIREIAYRLVALRGPSLSKRLGISEQNVWDTQATSMAVLAVQRPKLSCRGPRPVEIFVTPYRVLPICENTESVKLLSLLTHTCKIRPTSICLDVDLISQSFLEVFQTEKIITDNSLAVSTERVSCLSIMKCLLEDVVILRVESQKYPCIAGPMIALIEAAMGNGKLKSLFCSIPNLYMEIDQLISNLFLTKNFQMFHLELDDFSPQAMIKLFQAFMTSPCEAAQTLVINSSPCKRPPPRLTKQQIATLNLGSATVPECAIHHKMIQTDSYDPLLLFLLLLPCVRLIELELHPTVDDGVSYFHLCACHPNLHVKKLKLTMYRCAWSNSHKQLDMTIASDLQTLLSKPTLQQLLLTGNWNFYFEAKKGLIQGLQQQQMKPELQLKSMTLNMLGYSDEEVRTLLEVIVSFPEDRRPRVYKEDVFINAAKKLGTDYTYDTIFIFQDGFVSRKE